ncbi:hypothetical protein IAT38_004121 [Cryptococcus sp. DSM 104549]
MWSTVRPTGPSGRRLAAAAPARFFSTTTRRCSAGKPFKILFCGSDDFSMASLDAVHKATDLWSSIDVLVPASKKFHPKHKTQVYIPKLQRYAVDQSLPLSTVPLSGIKAWEPPSHFLPPSPPTSSADTTRSPPNSTHLLLTASFGHIIPNRLLNLFRPTHRLNLHPSLLPTFRGPAPLQWTIAKQLDKTGITVQTLAPYSRGIDSGDIVGQVDIDLGDIRQWNHSSLLQATAQRGSELLVDVLRSIRDGTATYTPQDHSKAVDAPMITRDTARVRWTEQSSLDIEAMYRAIGNQLPLWTTFGSGNTPVQLLAIRELGTIAYPLYQNDRTFAALQQQAHAPGTVFCIKKGKERIMVVACKKNPGEAAHNGWLEVLELQSAGKKAMGVKDWWNGVPDPVRESLTLPFT